MLLSDVATQSFKQEESSITSYPNPFTGRTTLRFELERPEHVSIEILNTLGQNVSYLADQNFDAGIHELEWTPKGTPPGIYFYRLELPTSVTTKALLFEK